VTLAIFAFCFVAIFWQMSHFMPKERSVDFLDQSSNFYQNNVEVEQIKLKK
jgi:hypothetical protein